MDPIRILQQRGSQGVMHDLSSPTSRNVVEKGISEDNRKKRSYFGGGHGFENEDEEIMNYNYKRSKREELTSIDLISRKRSRNNDDQFHIRDDDKEEELVVVEEDKERKKTKAIYCNVTQEETGLDPRFQKSEHNMIIPYHRKPENLSIIPENVGEFTVCLPEAPLLLTRQIQDRTIAPLDSSVVVWQNKAPLSIGDHNHFVTFDQAFSEYQNARYHTNGNPAANLKNEQMYYRPPPSTVEIELLDDEAMLVDS